MPRYYFRADGTALTLAAATSASAAGTAGDADLFNASTFAPGDILYISGSGGDYTTSTSGTGVLDLPDEGTAAEPIVIKFVDSAVIDYDSDTHRGIWVDDASHLRVEAAHVTHRAGTGVYQHIRIQGTSANVIFDGVTLTGLGANDADGFSLAEAAEVILKNFTITDIVAVSSIQAMTTHGTAQLVATNGTVTDCAIGITGVDSSRFKGEKIRFVNCTLDNVVIGSDDTCNFSFKGCEFYQTTGTANIFWSVSDDARMTFNSCGFHLAGTGAVNSIACGFHATDCYFYINASAMSWDFQSASAGIAEFKGCTFDLENSETNGPIQARQVATDPHIKILDCTVNYLNATTSHELLFVDADPTGNLTVDNLLVNGNGLDIGAEAVLRYETEENTPTITNCTFQDIDTAGRGVITIRNSQALINHNIFHNCPATADVVEALGVTTPNTDWNCYSGTTVTFPTDTNSIETDPEFENAELGLIKFASPCMFGGENGAIIGLSNVNLTNWFRYQQAKRTRR